MSEHYVDSLTVEEYESDLAEIEKAEAMVFGEKLPKKVYAHLESLENIVEVGVGDNDEEAYQDYLNNLLGLIAELETKRVKLQHGVVELMYTDVMDGE